MPKLYDTIRRRVGADQYLIGDHAANRLDERGVMPWQVVDLMADGELLAEHPSRRPNPTVEVRVTLPDGGDVCCVWSLLRSTGQAKLVTVYDL